MVRHNGQPARCILEPAVVWNTDNRGPVRTTTAFSGFLPREVTLIQRVLTVAALVSSATMAGAQQSFLGPGAAFISFGTARVATSELDERLAANGYPTFGQKAKSAGLGGYRILSNKVMLGAE